MGENNKCERKMMSRKADTRGRGVCVRLAGVRWLEHAGPAILVQTYSHYLLPLTTTGQRALMLYGPTSLHFKFIGGFLGRDKIQRSDFIARNGRSRSVESSSTIWMTVEGGSVEVSQPEKRYHASRSSAFFCVVCDDDDRDR